MLSFFISFKLVYPSTIHVSPKFVETVSAGIKLIVTVRLQSIQHVKSFNQSYCTYIKRVPYFENDLPQEFLKFENLYTIANWHRPNVLRRYIVTLGLVIGSHGIRDGVNTCASRSLSSSRPSSCRAVTKILCLQSRSWFTLNFLDSPQPSQEAGRFEGIRAYRTLWHNKFLSKINLFHWCAKAWRWASWFLCSFQGTLSILKELIDFGLKLRFVGCLYTTPIF